MTCALEGCGTTARCTRPDCPVPAAERRAEERRQDTPTPSRWSAPHSWAEATALGWTDYLWASVEAQRAMVEATEAMREAVAYLLVAR